MTSGAAPGLSDRLERIPVLTRSHYVWLLVLAPLLFFDFVDLIAFSVIAPAVRADWGLAISDIGLLTAVSFLGMFIGAVAGGQLADRFGRKRVILYSTVGYSLVSLASAFAVGVVDLAIYRLLIGVALQSMVVALLTYISEMYPTRLRGRVQAVVVAFSLFGTPAVALFAGWVVPFDPSAWRWVFVFGAGGLIVVAIGGWFLPESVRWQSVRGETTTSAALVDRLEAEAVAKLGTDLPPAAAAPPPPATGAVGELLRPPYVKRLGVLSAFMIISLSVFYGYVAWMPTLLVESGFTTQQTLSFVFVTSLAGIPGALLAVLFIDRVERRAALLAVYALLGVLLVVLAVTSSYGALVAVGTAVALVLQAGIACTYTYLPEIFPTRLRGLGAGLGSGAGRLAAFASSFLIAGLLASLGSRNVFIALGVAAAVAGLVIGLLGERTRNRSLEDISGSAADPVPSTGPGDGDRGLSPSSPRAGRGG